MSMALTARPSGNVRQSASQAMARAASGTARTPPHRESCGSSGGQPIRAVARTAETGAVDADVEVFEGLGQALDDRRCARQRRVSAMTDRASTGSLRSVLHRVRLIDDAKGRTSPAQAG